MKYVCRYKLYQLLEESDPKLAKEAITNCTCYSCGMTNFIYIRKLETSSDILEKLALLRER